MAAVIVGGKHGYGGGKLGFIDRWGEFKIEPQFIIPKQYRKNFTGSQVGFFEGKAAVLTGTDLVQVDPKKDRVGFINPSGKFEIEPRLY